MLSARLGNALRSRSNRASRYYNQGYRPKLVKLLLFNPPLRVFGLIRLYGLSGIVLFFFGSWIVWSLEAQVLARLDEDSAERFKRSILDECTMISVSICVLHRLALRLITNIGWKAAIIAQIAITELSLNAVSKTQLDCSCAINVRPDDFLNGRLLCQHAAKNAWEAPWT